MSGGRPISAAGPIVVVGSLNLDLVVCVDRLPVAGQTVHGHSLTQVPGGKGANQAVAAARLGAPVAMIGRVGDDSAADTLRAALRNAGVDDSAVLSVPGTSTGTALIHTDSAGQNSITVVAGANATLTSAELDRHADVIAGASMVLAQLEVPIETVEHLARLCEARGVPLMLDPAPAQALPAELLLRATWLTPNETEAATLCGGGTGDGAAMIARLTAAGAGHLILKQGSRGVVVALAGGAAFRSEGMSVTTVDTTAAGDCFNAAFAVALRRGDHLEAAARFANAAAALSTTRAGAQPSLPTLAEVEHFLHSQGT